MALAVPAAVVAVVAVVKPVALLAEAQAAPTKLDVAPTVARTFGIAMLTRIRKSENKSFTQSKAKYASNYLLGWLLAIPAVTSFWMR